MTNIQQPDMRRSRRTPLVQDSKEPTSGRSRARKEGRSVPADQLSKYGPQGPGGTNSDEPTGRPAEGD
jgi:hypothetical protein